MTLQSSELSAKEMLALHNIIQEEHFPHLNEIASSYEEELHSIGVSPAQYIALVQDYKSWHDGVMLHIRELIDYFENNHFEEFVHPDNGSMVSNTTILSWLHALRNKVHDGEGEKYETLVMKVKAFLELHEQKLYSLPVAEEPHDDKELENYWSKVNAVLGKSYPSYEISNETDVEIALKDIMGLINVLLNDLWLSTLPVLQEFEQNLVVHVPRMYAPYYWTEEYVDQVIGKLNGLYNIDTVKSCMALFHTWYVMLKQIDRYNILIQNNWSLYTNLNLVKLQIDFVVDHLNYAPDYDRTVEGLQQLAVILRKVQKIESRQNAPFELEEPTIHNPTVQTSLHDPEAEELRSEASEETTIHNPAVEISLNDPEAEELRSIWLEAYTIFLKTFGFKSEFKNMATRNGWTIETLPGGQNFLSCRSPSKRYFVVFMPSSPPDEFLEKFFTPDSANSTVDFGNDITLSNYLLVQPAEILNGVKPSSGVNWTHIQRGIYTKNKL